MTVASTIKISAAGVAAALLFTGPLQAAPAKLAAMKADATATDAMAAPKK